MLANVSLHLGRYLLLSFTAQVFALRDILPLLQV
jgi:hypothetical protein